jgi:hypothetical protein
MGRPSSFQGAFCEQAEKLCRLGATDKDLAEFFGVTEQTVNNWKDAHPEFFEALKRGKVESDAEVADRLYQRATGFEWDEAQPIKVREVIYENGKRLKEVERVEVVMVHRVVPPDTTAAIFWLKNRRPADWRDKVTQEHTADSTITGLLERIAINGRKLHGSD